MVRARGGLPGCRVTVGAVAEPAGAVRRLMLVKPLRTSTRSTGWRGRRVTLGFVAAGAPESRRWWPVWVGLSGCALLLAAVHLHQLTGAWGYTQTGTELLVHGGPGGGLALYSRHPELQMGPLTFAAGVVVLALPPALRSPVLWAAMTAAGVGLVAAVTGVARVGRGTIPVSRGTVAVGGAAVLAAWSVLAVPGGHLDDVLALGFAVAAVAARRQDRWDLAALLLGAAVDSKPWAVAFLPLLLDLHRPGRQQLRTIAVFTATVAVVWAPFLIADHDLSALSGLRIPDAADSALRVLGYAGPLTPRWDRPAQFAGGIAVGLVAVARGRPGGVLLAGLGVRLLLDPGTHTYYTAGLLLAALVFDLTTTTRAVPWATVVGFLLLFAPHLLLAAPGMAGLRGWLRATATLGAVLAVIAAPTAVLSGRTPGWVHHTAGPGPTGAGHGPV